MAQTAIDILVDPASPALQKVLASARLLHDHLCLGREVFDEIYGCKSIDGLLKIASQILWAYIEQTPPGRCDWNELPQPGSAKANIHHEAHEVPEEKTVVKNNLNPLHGLPALHGKSPSPDIDETHDRPPDPPRPVYRKTGRTLAQKAEDMKTDAMSVLRDHDPDAPGFVPIRYWGRSGYKFVTGCPVAWIAQFNRPGYRFCEGGFDDPVEAQKAALRAARKFYGFDKAVKP